MNAGRYSGNAKSTLMPCPFCANDRANGFSFQATFADSGFVICDQCGSCGPIVSGARGLISRRDENGKKITWSKRFELQEAWLKERAIAAWNDRAALARVRGGQS